MKSRYGAYKDHKKEQLYLCYTVYTVKVNQTVIRVKVTPCSFPQKVVEEPQKLTLVLAA